MFAIIMTGGKQYRVSKGERVRVDRLTKKPGEEVVFDKVIMIGDGDDTRVGTPVVKDAKVLGEVVKQARGSKVIVFKKRRKKGYKKTQGHRQDLTEVRIKDIVKS